MYGKLCTRMYLEKMNSLDSTYYKYSYIKYKLTKLNENPSKMWFKLCTFKMNKLFVMCGQTMFPHKMFMVVRYLMLI